MDVSASFEVCWRKWGWKVWVQFQCYLAYISFREAKNQNEIKKKIIIIL